MLFAISDTVCLSTASGDCLAMAKSLVFGNGQMHVGLDEHGLLSDLYFPYVGLENQLQPHGFSHKVGVYVDDSISWIDNGEWSVTNRYHTQTMVGETIAINTRLQLHICITSVLDREENIFMRTIQVSNRSNDEKKITLFCHQGFMISDSASSDTVQYRPDLPGVMHYKGKRVFTASLSEGSDHFDDFTVGQYDMSTSSSTFRDAEDGVLDKNTVDNGRTDSTIAKSVTIPPYESVKFEYVLVASKTVASTDSIFRSYKKNGSLYYMSRTAKYWHDWTQKARLSPRLDDRYKQAVYDSLIVISAHLDKRGAVMASLDSSLRNHPQNDIYSFCWGRDSVYILWSLLRLGYTEEIDRFFNFCERTIHADGYLSHKYRADGSLGSTWLPYLHVDGSIHPPIQADETASVLFLMGQYYRHAGDQAFIVKYYEKLIEPMARFLSGYINSDGLPSASYDLWEHDFETSTYTTSITYASLIEASELADAYGRKADADHWREVAESMKVASACFYNSEKQYFYKGFATTSDGTRIFDDLIDVSSVYGAFMYSLFDEDSPEIKQALRTAKQHLSKNSLYMRFVEDDLYASREAPNLWPIASLWMSQIALEQDRLDDARLTLDAVLDVTSPSGLIPEQVHPETHKPTSLSPLVWSHAEMINTIIDYAHTLKVQQ